ncbi:MAG: DNA alkylation repair protein [Gemmatimonadales bacterium]
MSRTKQSPGTVAERVKEALRVLESKGTKRIRDEMRTRHGIIAPKAFGVPVGVIQQLGKQLGRDHVLALALWETEWYEARMLAAFVDEPAKVTAAQMDRWVRDFDNWGICDTVCFKLFDQTAHAWKKVRPWSRRREEFARRAGFALLACLALHDKEASDEAFLECLPLIEATANDDRNFVAKGVAWALRAIGLRNARLNRAALDLATHLAESDDPATRRLGRAAARELAAARTKKGFR